MNIPKVSVIIPVYEVEKYLRQCIDSVVSQDYANLEIILVDDGSPDECPRICDEYGDIYNFIKVIHKENGGLSEARNEGLKIATGKYIMFVDSDDFLLNKTIISSMIYYSNEDTQLILARHSKYFETYDKYINEKSYNLNGVIKKIPLLKKLSSIGIYPIAAWSKLIDRQLIQDNNINFLKNYTSEDIDWFCNLISKVEKICVLDQVIYGYRQRSGSISREMNLKKCNDMYSMISYWSNNFLESSTIEFRNLMLGFLAYEYCILLGIYSKLNKADQILIRSDLLKINWLLRYNQNPKVLVVSILYKIIGFEFSSRILGFYITK